MNQKYAWQSMKNNFQPIFPPRAGPPSSFVLVQVNRDWGDGQRKSGAIFCYLSLAKWHSSGSRGKYESVIGILKVEVHIAAWGILRFRHAQNREWDNQQCEIETCLPQLFPLSVEWFVTLIFCRQGSLQDYPELSIVIAKVFYYLQKIKGIL